MTEWHPCSWDDESNTGKGLPRRSGPYMVTVKYKSSRWVEIMELATLKDRELGNPPWEGFWGDSAVAWAELPKPYAGRLAG